MNKSYKIILGVCAAVWLGFVLFFPAGSHREPKLVLNYFVPTNLTSQSVAFFTITNLGTAAAVTYNLGEIEISGQTKKEHVAYKSNRHPLLPGEGDIIRFFYRMESSGVGVLTPLTPTKD